MKTFSLITCLVSFSASIAFADTFTLKDGTTLQGKIIKEEADSYMLEVQVTKSIKDERKVLKEDITKIEKPKTDLLEFKKIESLSPIPDMQPLSEYNSRIYKVGKFLTRFPKSEKATEAKAIQDSLKKEAEQIRAGGRKFKGKIISNADYQADAYELDARFAEAKIRSLASSTRYGDALRSFADFEKDFQFTKVYVELLPFIRQVVSSYQKSTKQMLVDYETWQKNLQPNMERLSEADRARVQASLDADQSAFASRYQTEKDMKVGWVTVDPHFKPSLENAIAFANQELSRLARDTRMSADGGALYRDAYRMIQEKKATPDDKNAVSDVTKAISAVKTAKVPLQYVDILESNAKAAGLIRR